MLSVYTNLRNIFFQIVNPINFISFRETFSFVFHCVYIQCWNWPTKNGGGQMSNFPKFYPEKQGLKFKADFHSKMCIRYVMLDMN